MSIDFTTVEKPNTRRWITVVYFNFCSSGYSVSSAENEGRCSAIANCLARRPSFPLPTHSNIASSKVTPQPTLPNSGSMSGAPRLVRSRAVRRDIVQDWNFDEVAMGR
ncbi:hypothetical protein CerSpe_273220 [Prunus speciosa]